MKKIKLIVKTKSKKYPIIIGKNILKNISTIINSNQIRFKKCLIVVDKKIPKKKLSELMRYVPCKKKIVYSFNPIFIEYFLEVVFTINLIFFINIHNFSCYVTFRKFFTVYFKISHRIYFYSFRN